MANKVSQAAIITSLANVDGIGVQAGVEDGDGVAIGGGCGFGFNL